MVNDMESESKTNELFKDYDDVVTIEDIMNMLHIGRTTVYELLKDGTIYSVRIGKRYIVPKQAIINLISIPRV